MTHSTAVNALGVRTGGAFNHLAGLVENWTPVNGATDHLYVFTLDDIATELVGSNPRVSVLAKNRSGLRRLFWDEREFENEADGLGCRVIVSIANHGPIHHNLPHIVFQRNPWYFLDTGKTSANRLARFGKARLAVAASRRSDITVAPSEYMAEHVASRCGLRDDQIRTLRHPIDQDSLISLANNSAGVPQLLDRCDGLKLIFVSHAGAHKRHDLVIEAFAKILEQQPNATLALTIPESADDSAIGAAYLDDIFSLARHIPRTRIRFVGAQNRSDTAWLTRWADISIVASDLETFSFPVYEALAQGTAVVASDIGAHREAARFGAVSLFDNRSPGALVDAIQKISIDRHTAVAELQDLAWPKYIRGFQDLINTAANI